jgi:transposase, IS5 family
MKMTRGSLSLPTVPTLGRPQEKIIESKQMINKICEKGYRNKPLTQEQKYQNAEKSRTRSRVEHIFGFMEKSMNEMDPNNIDIKRITAIIGLMNLTCNMYRNIHLYRLDSGNCIHL